MSDDPRHDNRVGAVSAGSVGNAHGPLTINNFNQAPPTPTDDPQPDRIELRLALPDPPQSLYSPSRSPYPLFRPYDDPALFAGRDADIAALLACLAGDHPIVGVHAPSGYGKSSLLLAGLAPALRRAGHPVVIERSPADPRLAQRLLKALLLPAPPLADDEHRAFLTALEQATAPSVRPPVLVLDQFEAVFKTGDDEAPRARVALLIAATIGAGLPVRWVLSYRAEFAWQIVQWLDHAHEEIARRFPAHAAHLPRLGRHRIKRYAVGPFGAEAPDDAFREAIERPLIVAGWTIAPDDLDRLTALFADARRKHWLWPLVPELQVVLDRRVKAAVENTLTAPTDLDTDLRAALRGHIEAVIDRLASDHSHPPIARALIGVALRRLVDDQGRRDETGLTRDELRRTIDDATLDALEGWEARLLMVHRDKAGPGGRYTLSHDTIAAEVAQLGGEGWFGALAEADRETLRIVLGLDQRIGNLAALYDAEETEGALVLSRDDMARISEHHAPLLWDDTRRRWWTAALAHRQRRIRRAALVVAAAVLAVVAVAYGIGWTERQTKIDRAVAQIAAGNAVLRNLQDLIDLGHDGARIDGLIDGAELEEVEDTPDDPVEGARARFIRRRLTGPAKPVSVEDFGRLIAGVEAGAHPEAPGRLTAEARRGLRADIRAALLSRFPAPAVSGGATRPIEWVTVEGGSFEMGDERGQNSIELPVRRVTLPGFELSRAEVTIGQYRAFDAEGYARNLGARRDVANVTARWGDDAVDRPAWMVNWHEASAFALWADPEGRLPTEAEWEFATRGGVHAPAQATLYWSGGDETDLAAVGWYDVNSGGRPHPVCSPPKDEPRHPLGLCDVHGNLFEWVADAFDEKGYPEGPAAAPPGPRPRRGALRVNRGGSFLLGALDARSAFRDGFPPGSRTPNLGFRLARSAPSSEL